MVAFQNRTGKEVSERKRKAREAYWALKRVFKINVGIPSKIKMLNHASHLP